MPTAAPKPCPKHPSILLHGKEPCPKCQATRTHNWGDDKYRGNRHERGYGTAWEKLRDYILLRDKYLCQPCLKNDRITPAQEVDHIIAKANGGTDDEQNLQGICKACHRAKTYQERHNKTEYKDNGLPTNSEHHWNK